MQVAPAPRAPTASAIPNARAKLGYCHAVLPRTKYTTHTAIPMRAKRIRTMPIAGPPLAATSASKGTRMMPATPPTMTPKTAWNAVDDPLLAGCTVAPHDGQKVAPRVSALPQRGQALMIVPP